MEEFFFAENLKNVKSPLWQTTVILFSENNEKPFSVPPTTSVLLDEKGSEVEGSVGPYNVGGTLILTCDILGGKTIVEEFWAVKISYTKHRMRI